MRKRRTIKRLPLKKMFNTRDLGGMPTEDGREIVSGKLIRSGKLYKIPPETVEALKNMGVETILDLRIYTEVEESPDQLWDGVKYVHLPILCTATPGITRERTMRITMKKESKRIKEEFGSADNYMSEMYRAVLLNEEPKKLLAEALRYIIENEGCILWHCSGGKDRAGIVAMLVESLLGVKREYIIADYVASRKFQRARFFWNRLGLVIAPISIQFKSILFRLMDAKPRYLLDSLKEIEEKYGSVTAYCMAELGVTEGDIAVLKQKYLV